MSVLRYPGGAAAIAEKSDMGVTPLSTGAEPQFVYNCSRIGLQANPPSFRLGFGWLRRR
ncbi:hypothetical protein [Mycobacterium sp. MS1601]|uniref:hypothetical protein n=1 Tax=Mycobacterium sp. MS1601 TaxID=1936029 RepID=UPI0012F89296|nr:hypothetical protein [Mycobacterium sp. MS1601]